MPRHGRDRRARTCGGRPVREKADKAPRDLLNVWLTVIRGWQLASSLLVYATVLLVSRSSSFVRGHRSHVVQSMIFITLGYSAFLLLAMSCLNRFRGPDSAAWRIVARVSVPGDLVMLSVYLTKIAVVGTEYIECSAQSRETYTADHKIMAMLAADEPAKQRCYFPSHVFAFGLVAVLSYILSILFTIIQLVKYRRAADKEEVGSEDGNSGPETVQVHHVRMPSYGHVEAIVQGRQSFDIRAIAPPAGPRPASNMAPQSSQSSQNQASDLDKDPDDVPDPKYANMPEGIVDSMAVGRRSQDTTSSFNPELYLVSDGFHRDDPPAYSSRPPSLRSLREL